MSDFMEELYRATGEFVCAQCFHREERIALAKEKLPLMEEIDRRLGEDGRDLLDRFLVLDDEISELHHYEVFRHALALGLELGRLPSCLTV